MLRYYEEDSPAYGVTLSQRARARADGGDATGARLDYEAALAIDRDNRNALLGLGKILLDAGDLESAERYLHRSLTEHGSGRAADMLGGYALQHGDYERAQSYYGRMLENEFPDDDAIALYGRGVARLRLGDEGGRADIEEGLRLNPRAALGFEERGIRP